MWEARSSRGAILPWRQSTFVVPAAGTLGRRNSFRVVTSGGASFVFGRAQFITAATGGQTLTQSSRLDNVNTFYTHTLTPGAVALTQSARFDNSQSFFTHALSLGGITLTQGTRFDNSPSFFTHTVSVGAVTLTQSSRFDNSATFFSHVLNNGGTVLTQDSRLDNSNSFFTHTVTPGAVTLTPSLFSNSNTFYTHTLTQAGPQTLTQSARFDNESQFFQQIVAFANSVESGWAAPILKRGKAREYDYLGRKQSDAEIKAERIKLGIIEPDVVEKQQKAPVVAKTQQFLPSDWVAKEQEIAKEADQVAAKKEAVEQGTEDYWALHLYEQLLRQESERLAQEAIVEARRKAEEADVAFVIMTLAALH